MKYRLGIPAMLCATLSLFGSAKHSATRDFSESLTADLVVYSFDRPMQLYAFLESLEKYVSDLHETHVIYRTSSDEYEQSYELVKQRFPNVIYTKQSDNPRQDFKPLTLDAAFKSSSAYLIFAVDDIIIKDTIHFADDIALLEETHAYGFYYRLGKNLSYCYALNSNQAIPPLNQVAPHVYSWQFRQGQHDWAYPNTVDMTLYRKKDIKSFFEYGQYNSPNTLEARWAAQAYGIMNQYGLCYDCSKIVNLPLNRVQNDFKNRSMEVPAHELQKLFTQGLKIDISPLYHVENMSAHMEYTPTFIAR